MLRWATFPLAEEDGCEDEVRADGVVRSAEMSRRTDHPGAASLEASPYRARAFGGDSISGTEDASCSKCRRVKRHLKERIWSHDLNEKKKQLMIMSRGNGDNSVKRMVNDYKTPTETRLRLLLDFSQITFRCRRDIMPKAR